MRLSVLKSQVGGVRKDGKHTLVLLIAPGQDMYLQVVAESQLTWTVLPSDGRTDEERRR